MFERLIATTFEDQESKRRGRLLNILALIWGGFVGMGLLVSMVSPTEAGVAAAEAGLLLIIALSYLLARRGRLNPGIYLFLVGNAMFIAASLLPPSVPPILFLIAISATDFTFFAKRFLINLSTFMSKLNYVYADQLSPCANFNQRWEIPFGGRTERVATIYNGVNPSVFVPGPKPPEFQNYPTCVAAARIFPLKDLETMIRGVAVAHKSIPNLKVIVFGSLKADRPYVQKCRDLTRELGLGPGTGNDTTGDDGADDIDSWTFRFAGYHNQPAKIFTTGDISLLSSISEGFPFTVLESMSCGTPVVGTDVGGVREALEGHGVVAPPRDPEAFGAGIVKLLSDSSLRQRLGRKCRETIITKFMTSTSVDGYRESYERWAAYKREHLDDIRAENAKIIAAWEEEIDAIRQEATV